LNSARPGLRLVDPSPTGRRVGPTGRRVDPTPRRARRLQLNSTEVEHLRSWSIIDDLFKTGLGQGFGTPSSSQRTMARLVCGRWNDRMPHLLDPGPCASGSFALHLIPYTFYRLLPATSNQKPATRSQQPGTSNQRPATSNHVGAAFQPRSIE
jgi:hypothetical protein